MKLSPLYTLGAIVVFTLSLATAATAGTTELTSGETMDYGPTVVFSGGGTPQLLVDSGAAATIDGATFENDTNGTNINSSGTTIINSATFTNDGNHLITVEDGVTDIYGATIDDLATLDVNVRGNGVVNIYGDFGADNGLSFNNKSSLTSFSGTLQNNTTSETFTDNIGGNGIINFLPASITPTPEPSSLTAFAIAGLALAGFALMRRRARA